MALAAAGGISSLQPVVAATQGGMVVKTADGWKSKSHVKSQGAPASRGPMAQSASCSPQLALPAEKAWRKARSKLQEMIGEECMRSKAALSEKAETIFKSIDTDNSGGLDVPELKACFEKAGVELTQSEAKAMVTEADENGCVQALCSTVASAHTRARSHASHSLCL